MLSLAYPANAVLFYSLIITVSNFEVVNTDDINDKFFDFTETEPVNMNFDMMGYPSKNSINNLGVFFWYMLLLTTIYALMVPLKQLSSKHFV